MKPSAGDIQSFLKEHLPCFEPKGEPAGLEGGNLNHVWRVEGANGSVIVKHAPPFIAKNPDVPIDPVRLDFEAKALSLFTAGGLLEQDTNQWVRPPKIYGYDKEKAMLAMEDITPSSGWFDEVLRDESKSKRATELGKFIGTIHRKTHGESSIAKEFRNLPIQQTRQHVQYDAVEETLREYGNSSTGAVENAKKLGEKLTEPGSCLVMGDLWPPSVLWQVNHLRLIDWEFAHYGRPLQDLAHFVAHCIMYQVKYREKSGNRFMHIWQAFLEGYKLSAGSSYSELLSREELFWFHVHVGAEILIRTIGAFREGYIFESFGLDSGVVSSLAEKAVEMMDHPEQNSAVTIF